MSRPTQDEIDRQVAEARTMLNAWLFPGWALTSLADDLKAARERRPGGK